jgi:hypothetical protein
MSVLTSVELALSRWPQPSPTERGVRVTTHCLYPSNSAVAVIVSSRGEQHCVDDDAATLDLVAQSVHTDKPLKSLMRGIVKHYGCLLTERGEIMSPLVGPCELEGAIVVVANASRAAAQHLLSSIRPPRRDLRANIEELLNLKFKDRWLRNGRLTGASNKEHGFDYLINMPGGRQLAMDFVVPEASSINSAVVAHLDLRNRHSTDIEQRIIYDDTKPWQSSDIELLKAGARPVPLSSLRQALERVSA